ncbi:metalloregulator ArsR/SmtB family transcription factor [Polynucleobacter sp. IMCC 29146]|uniref:ArsR/SmtB family transcription factor n=1 Tax=Polynucleobacter sp. IMCC 29146 TaxID=2780953 RepID=UPI001F2C7803|nr:metalloregulator ArsR/SmtB family transcription factor [Polynucleobacter sp. IMCC 29146]MCE7528826.1 metalloregulator ArsR/SmtB family transcription factor [Polynucleobacter sp. IMCC 29146]
MLMARNLIDLKKMQHSAGEAVKLLKALTHPDRMLLLCQISKGERCVGELENLLNIHQPMLSQHLGALKRAKLVKTRRVGKNIYYAVANDFAMSIIDQLYRHYCLKNMLI